VSAVWCVGTPRMGSDERAEENQGGGSLFLCLKGIWKGSDGGNLIT
jgi:hypothetical protein